MNRRKACLLLASAPAAVAREFRAKLPEREDRPWLGPEFWANPLQDWRLRNGRMECFVAGGDRNVYLLTHSAAARSGDLHLRVRLGRLEGETGKLGPGFVGFRVGIRGFFDDYRDSAVYGIGLNAGIASGGKLFIGGIEEAAPKLAGALADLVLVLEAAPSGDRYRVRLAAQNDAGATLAEIVRSDLPAEWLTGGVALVCSSGAVEPTPDAAQAVMTPSGINKRGTERSGNLRFWFRDWEVSGTKVDVDESRAWGPILWTMHTVNRGLLKLTVQMAPVAMGAERVRLQVPRRRGGWRTVARAAIDRASRTAVFGVRRWNQKADVPFRVVYRMVDASGRLRRHYYEGVVRRDPVDKERIVAAGLSCNNDLGFPHNDIVRNVRHFRPDLIAFLGDQIYERVGGYGIERAPLEIATLDYLRKWFLFGWAYRDLLRDTPCVCLPDDHDVYHGNLWGAGGRRAEGAGQPGQDSGGYVQPAAWVNMVQRTQTSHLPDPFDPTPAGQGIGSYYTSLVVGGVSFAILEDRKWKSAPKETLPDARIVNGWAQNANYRAEYDGDAPGAQILGERQMRFLGKWAADWSGGVWMKCVVTQTIFANLATLPKPANTDAVTPKLPVLRAGEYSRGEALVADHDSNGWPQTPRNEALRLIRKACAVHIAGDQHLGSTLQYGVENWDDAAWAMCVPAVANIFPRRWYPPEAGLNRDPNKPRNTGQYKDGFGNRMTVHAVFNPGVVEREPRLLNLRAPGYGIVDFDRGTRRIHLAVWPRWEDASGPGATPCPGWPVVVDQTANGLPNTGWVLDPVEVPERQQAVVQVIDEGYGRIVYTLRLHEQEFIPPVWTEGVYTVRLFDPDGTFEKVAVGQRARRAQTRATPERA